MSKAFTREDDAMAEEPTFSRVALAAGVPNYMTADGAERCRVELATLAARRSELEDDGGETSREELRRTNAKINLLSQRLAEAVVVPPPDGGSDEVRFGMFVTIRDADGSEDEYRLVGVDEVDLEAGWISWLSPLAKALMGKKVGDVARFEAPVGEKAFTLLRIRASGACER